jgi:hypothetical protein
VEAMYGVRCSGELGTSVSWFVGFFPCLVGGVPDTDVASSLGALVVELHLHPRGALALREKSLAQGSLAGDGGGYVTPFLEALFWRVRVGCRM